MGQHTQLDPSRAPEGKHTLYCYAHVPAHYARSDEDVADLIEAQENGSRPAFHKWCSPGRFAARSSPRPRTPVWSTATSAGGPTSLISSSSFARRRNSVVIAPLCRACTSAERPFTRAGRSRAWAAGQRPGRCSAIVVCAPGVPDLRLSDRFRRSASAGATLRRCAGGSADRSIG